MLDAQICTHGEIRRVSVPGDRWRQRVQEMLDAYTASIRKLSDEALITMHQEHLKLHADELAEITRTELNRRGLPVS